MAGVVISSGVFQWLWKSSGVTAEEISEKINIAPETVNRWCHGDTSPRLTVKHLETLSATFKRPISAFLLPEAPQEYDPKDFRSRKDRKHTYSKETWLAFRRARRHLSDWIDLREKNGEERSSRLPKISLDLDPEDASASERQRLKVPISPKWKNGYEAFRYWRSIFESHALPVYQIRMPIEEARGFSLQVNGTALIVVNSRDAIKGRIFSLFHEYAHLLLDEPAICTEDSEATSDKQIRRIEHWCNTFSGAFLMPREAITSNSRVVKALTDRDAYAAAHALATRQKVSVDAALIRLKVLGHITEFQSVEAEERIRSEWLERERKSALEKKNQDFSRSPVAECITEHGERFVSMAIKSEARGQISYAEMLDCLGLKANHVKNLRLRERDD